MEKIYFDGCSYTWGQSLELYYNDLDIFTHDRMSKYVFKKEDINFITKNRYSAIVSNVLDLDETNKSKSSKSNGKILYDLKSQNIDNFKYCIIQLTHFDRFFTNGYEWITHPACYENLIKEGKFTKDDVNNSILNVEKIQYDYFLELEKIFINCPEKLKIIFHSNEWEDILTKEEIKKYGISIDGEYMIRRWAEKNNMFINQQPQFKFHKASSHDTHLCMEGHKILAESIIKQL
jgi:hypothetical protein